MRPDDAVFQRIKRLVIDRTLHHYYEGKDEQFADRLHRRLKATGLDAAAYLSVLERGEAEEWGDLESEITINETFFFRFAEQFACLRDTILPALIEARAATRRLRIWSAGCSTGAEPYSVAILLHRLLGDALKDWSISILGTDIDEQALRQARSGEYGDWALRSLSPAERRLDFIANETTGGAQVSRWLLRPAYLSMVQFRKQNLLDWLGAGSEDRDQYDLVLCRNVLIYFHHDKVRALVRRFGQALAPDGWLLLGHAEGVGQDLPELRPEAMEGTVVWRRSGAGSPPARTSIPEIVQNAPAERRAPQRRALPEPAEKPVSRARSVVPVEPSVSESLETAIENVRELADRGMPESALGSCREALNRHPLSEDLFFYAALLNRALDRDGEAEGDFRRALYLSKSFIMAHYHLGLLLHDAGKAGPGRRAVSEAVRLAREVGADTVLRGGDGMTAGRFLALAQLNVPTRAPAR